MKLLDLFCGAGGAGMGYSRAGFDVTGVDIKPQKNYPFPFVQADALEYLAQHGHEYDVIHASPPCQAYAGVTAWRGDRSKHPDLIAATQAGIRTLNVPYVIENVPDARRYLRTPFMLCGSAFGLRVRSHRYFESPLLPLSLQAPCQHRADDLSRDHGAKQTEAEYRDALGCEWMTVHEARQAIPPAYTSFIGSLLLAQMQDAA